MADLTTDLTTATEGRTQLDTVTVSYFAAARAAAGISTETVPAGTLRSVLDLAAARHGTDLARVLGACSYLVDGVSRSDHDAPVEAGASIDVLPPFAGG